MNRTYRSRSAIKSLLPLSLASMCSIIAACGGQPETETEALKPPLPHPGADNKQSEVSGDTQLVRQALGAPGSLSPLIARGGSGGGDFGNFDNGIVYAFRARYGVRVDQIELAYYIPSAGTNYYTAGNFLGSIGPFGGGGGIDSGWQYCPSGYGAVGFHGKSGTGIDRIGIICGDIANTSTQWFSNLFGGGGGSTFSDTCNSGGFLTGTSGRSGIWVDRLQGNCRSQ